MESVTVECAETALCLWEACLECKFAAESDEKSPLLIYWGEKGTSATRAETLVWAEWVNQVYEELPGTVTDGFCFDWELVPAMLNLIQFDGDTYRLPSVESAVEALTEEFDG